MKRAGAPRGYRKRGKDRSPSCEVARSGRAYDFRAAISFALFALVGLAARTAKADAGDLGLGIGGSYVTPSEGRVSLRGSYGVSDFVSLRGDLGIGFSHAASEQDAFVPNGAGSSAPDGFTRGLLSAGFVYAYDVVTLVPEVGVYGGASLVEGTVYGRGAAMAGIRRYLSRTTSIVLSAGAEYDGARAGGDHVHAVVDLGFWFL